MTDEKALAPRTWLLGSLIALSLFRLATLGLYPLMDTTEARYADIARRMSELGDWVTPWFDYGVPFWGKPPLAFWLTAGSFRLFGVNEFAARLPHFLLAVATAWLVWDWAKRRTRHEALIAMTLLAGSVLFVVSAGAVMTDMALALGTTLAMRGFWLGLHGSDRERSRERWLLFLGIAVGLLAKGPVVLVLVALPLVLWVLATRSIGSIWSRFPWFRGTLLTVAIVLPWYVVAELRSPGFLHYFLVGEHWHRFLTPGWKGDLYGSAHAYPRGSIWLFAAAAALPWSVLIPIALFGRRDPRPQLAGTSDRAWQIYLLSWAAAPCLFFSFAGNILPAYVLPALPAFALLATDAMKQWPHAKTERLLSFGVGLVLVVAVAVLAVNSTAWIEVRSAKGLVADYNGRRTAHEPLIFLGPRPFSASFYSAGTAEQVADAQALAARVANTRAFVAVRAGQIVPQELRRHLYPLGTHGRFELYATKHVPQHARIERSDGP